MNFNYYRSLTEECARIETLCQGCLEHDPARSAELRLQSVRWREMMCLKLYNDPVPPIGRRDLFALTQNLGYVSYEVLRLCLPEGGLKNLQSAVFSGLQKLLAVLTEETALFETGRCCAERIRREALGLFSKLQNPADQQADAPIMESVEAVADAVLRYADALETAAAMNRKAAK